MKPRNRKVPLYLLIFVLPVLLVALVVGGLNLAFLFDFRQTNQRSLEEQDANIVLITSASQFNRELATVQRLVDGALDDAAGGKIDEGGVYRIHSLLVNRLAALDQQLAAILDSNGDPVDAKEAKKDFETYRNLIISTTDLAAVDPPGAAQQAHMASQSYVALSEHTHHIAERVAQAIRQRSEVQAERIEARTTRMVGFGGAVIAVLLLFWLFASNRMTRRMTALTHALQDLSSGEVNPPSLPVVQSTHLDSRSVLQDMASAVLSFRAAIIDGRSAQYALGERMKELSCLYDVKVLTEDRHRDPADVLTAVAQRLPAAMRYPELAVGWIDFQGRRFGRSAEGEHLSVRFGGTDEQPDILGLTYTGPLPPDAGATFLHEEEALFDAMAKRLSDVMEIRRSEAALAQADRALRTARTCSQMLIRAQEEGQLMQDICRLAVEVGGYRMAWVGLAEDDVVRSVRPVASAGFEDNYLETAQITWADVERGRGPTGTAIRDRRTVVAREILTNPSLAPWRAAALQRGYASAIALPLLVGDDRCIGALSLYAHEHDAFNTAEVELLDEMANDLSFGIRTLRTRSALDANLAEIRKLSLVVEQSPNSIVVTSLEARIEYVNDAFTRNTGFTREEVMGKNPKLLKSGKTPASTYETMWQTLLDKKAWTGEFFNRTRQGLDQIEAAIIVPLVQSDGRVSHYVAIKEDITARRQQEDQLRKLYLAVEQSPESIVITDIDANIEYVNEAFQRNTGYSREEALGLNPRVLKSGKTPKATYDDMWATLTRGATWQGELFNRRKDGSEYAEFANIAPIRQPDGAITHYVAIKEDVTEKRRMAQELDQHRLHLEDLVNTRTAELSRITDALLLAGEEQMAIFETATSGMALIKDRVLVSCNGRLCDMFGFLHGAMVGQPTSVWYPDAQAEALGGDPVYAEIWQGLAHRREQQLKRLDGSLFWARLTGKAVNVDDRSKGTVWVIDDISEERAALVEIQKARAAAEAANQSKSEFLANMSHEIRTPMNAIIGMSHLALQTELDRKQRNYVEKVHRAGENLLGIINDILDFSKIEAGKMNMEAVDFNLDDVMDNLANLVGMKTEDKGLELLFSTAPDVPNALVGDALRLGQVLINLGNNAAKFTERGEIVVGIDKVADHADGVELHFWVRDTGIGMTPEQCDRMFQSFSQADASTTRKYGGTGLGLAISKNLVERMRGRIWVDSVPGQGSTFHFNARFGVQANPQTRRMFRADELRGVRVLVVDDNASAREILSAMARTFGLEVEVARDGSEALRLIAASDKKLSPYDLVLMDWKMPVMDGVETVRHLRSEKLSRIPTVIMVTAYGREDAMASAVERGVPLQTVLTKPVTPSTLLEAVGEALDASTDVTTRQEARADDYADALDKLKGARVLLVEDNDLNQELAMELLANAGMTVVLAQHGREALDILARDPHFDGVLMDCQMPVMDGYTATREIRKDPAFKDLPIIAMTANAMAGDKDKVLEAGMWDHIAKPLNVGAMFATLARWIHPVRAAAMSEVASESIAVHAINTDKNSIFGIESLPGVDTRFGLATALNKESLYRRLLLKFRDRQGAFADLFVQARGDTDPLAAQRCAHTLRGSAGTVGAKGVQQAAQALELACQQAAPREQIDDLLRNVLEELQPVMQGLQALGGENAGTAEPLTDGLDLQELTAQRTRLLELLDHGDSKAIDLCDEHDELFRAAYPAQWKKISGSVHDFDFEAALTLIQQTT